MRLLNNFTNPKNNSLSCARSRKELELQPLHYSRTRDLGVEFSFEDRFMKPGFCYLSLTLLAALVN